MPDTETAAMPVDWEEGLSRAGDDVEFFKELIELFLDDVPSRLQALENAVGTRDAANAAATAHSIKGAAANLSATRVREQAYIIETTAREGDWGGIDQEVERLKQEVACLEAFAQRL